MPPCLAAPLASHSKRLLAAALTTTMRLLAAALTLASTHAVHDIVDLYAKPDTSMRTQLGAHFQDGHPVNALVVFHLEGCVFCEITMGTMLYDTTHDGALNATGIQPFKLLVDAEGTPNGTFTFCSGSADCVAQSKKVLGVDPAALTSFPTTYYYDAAGAASDVSDTKCGIAVRRDGPAGCAPATAEACAPAANDLSNWVSNAATKDAETDCAAASPAWERCAKKN